MTHTLATNTYTTALITSQSGRQATSTALSTGVAAASAGSESYVTLQADASNGALAAGDYYIAVKPGTLADLSIAYKYTDHTAKAKQSSNSGGSSLTLEAGHIKAISANFSTGTVRDAKQLWENGPYFATMNVGETTETGNTQMYMWGATAADGSQNTGAYDLDHDTAYKIWGSAWRMPTKDEFSSLNSNCNHSGGKLSDTNYCTTFTTGYGSINLHADDTSCRYWSATPNDNASAYHLYVLLYSSSGAISTIQTACIQARNNYGYVRAVLR